MEKVLLSSVPKEGLIVQSNKLIEARYSLTIHEQRIVLMMLSMIRKEDKDFHVYKIAITDFVKIIGLKNKNIYRQIKDTLTSLDSKRFTIETDDGYLRTGWTSDAEYKGKEGLIEISFSPKLKPYLLDLKSKFTSYQLNTVIHFKTSMSIRIYALLKQYEKIGKRIFEIEDLKEILEIDKDSYPVYQDFKRRVIVPAQKELLQKNDQGDFKSDLRFDFFPVKSGRKTTAIKFVIIKTPKRRDSAIALPIQSQIFLTLRYYGIPDKDTFELLKDNTEEELNKCADILDDGIKRGKVKNPVAYFLKLVNAGAGKISEYEVEKNKKLSEKEDKVKERKDEAERTIVLKKASKKIASDFIDSLPPEGKEELIKKVLLAYEGKKFETALIENTGLLDPMIRAEVIKHIPNYEEEKEAYINSKL